MEMKKIEIRTCKKCQKTMEITFFGICKNKNSTNITHRYKCKVCEKMDKRAYFVKYHKLHYVPKPKKPKKPKKTKKPKKPKKPKTT